MTENLKDDQSIQRRTGSAYFASSTEQTELETQLRQLAKEIASTLSTLELDQSKELLGAFVSDLFLSVADRERREFRRQRQAEGITAAKARGVRFGPERLTLPSGFEDAVQLWSEGAISANRAAKELGMSRDRFLRRAREFCTSSSRP